MVPIGRRFFDIRNYSHGVPVFGESKTGMPGVNKVLLTVANIF